MVRPRRGEPAAAGAGRWGRAGWLALPLLLAALAYARVLRGEFVLDDFPAVLHNAAVKDLPGTLRALPGALLRSGRSLTDATFALNHAVGGLDPFGFHLANLVIHLAAASLAYLFTRAVLRLAGVRAEVPLAVVVAGLFALHPLQSQAVSYVVQRAESLASGLYLATLLLLLAAERRGWSPRGIASYAIALLAFALGMGAKPVLVTLPAAWLLLALLPGPDRRGELAPWPRRLAMLVPLAALDLWMSVSTLGSMEGSTHVGFSVPGVGPWTYLLTQARAVATYLRLIAWPAGQSGYWVVPPSRSLAEPATLGSAAFLVALLAGAVALAVWGRREARRTDGGGAAGHEWSEAAAAARAVAFGLLWFFLLLAPTSSVVPLADLLVEHRAYLASWGVFLAVAVGASRFLARLPIPAGRRAIAAVAVVAVVWGALAVALHRRNAVWETRLAFWSDAVAKAPRAQRPRLNLAQARWERGEIDEAIRQFHLALEYGGRGSPADEAFILNNLAVALLSAGRTDDAEAALRRAIALEPRNATAHANLALALLRQNDLAGAEEEAGRALALRPEEAGAWMVLGGVHMARGDAAGAVEPLERAVRLDPDDGARWLDLASANEKAGRLAEACGAWRRVLRLPVAAELREAAAARAAAAGCSTPSRSPR